MAVWKQNLIVLWLGLFLVNAGMTMIVPFLPLYLQDLGITDPAANTTWSGLIFAANFITSFFVQPIWGRLSDRYGHKVMILRSGIGMAIVMTMMGFATSPWQLLLLRLLNGTVAGFNPASLALMASIAPKHKMGTVMGLMQSGIIGGTILGPRWERYGDAPYGELEEGNVFTIEPTILMSPQPSMLVEENVVVTATGAEWLSRRQTELWLAGR